MKIKRKNIYSFCKVYFLKNNLKIIDYRFKQILKIIYDFNYKKKYIWFLGFIVPKKYKGRHLFISKYNYIKGLISNEKFIRLTLNNKKSNINLIKPSLVVVFCLTKNDLPLLEEFNKLNIPVLIIGSIISKFKCTLYVSVSDNLNELRSFFSFLIFTILKFSTKKND